MSFAATVILSTKNRRELLESVLRSAINQSAPVEVIVVDDGSTDGTSAMVRQQFPLVRLISHAHSKGYIVRRNEAVRLASSNFVFSIDDDAIFSSCNTVAQTLTEFDHPRCGAIAIPFINIRNGDRGHLREQRQERCAIASFVGTAFAVRRDVFLQIGGFRECFFHQGEEEDFCLRLLETGHFVREGSAEPIHHFESPIRDVRRLHVYGPRNLMLFCLLNVPLPYAPPHLVVSAVKCLMHGLRIGQFSAKVIGVAKGLCAGVVCWRQRTPVSPATYRLFRKLKRTRFLSVNGVVSE